MLNPIDCGTQFCTTGKMVHAIPLLQFDWLHHGSTTRTFNDPQIERLADLRAARSHLELDDFALIFAQQKHTSNIAIVDERLLENLASDHHSFRETDAIISLVPGAALAILTADCAPVFIVDPRLRRIALVHAGWKGTLARITEKTVHAMADHGSKPGDLVAWVGPMAGGCCYEVSEEMIAQFRQEFSDASQKLSFIEGRNLDLVSINAHQLELAGLNRNFVFRSNLCTIHQRDQFYSYRADEGTHGRIISCMGVIANPAL